MICSHLASQTEFCAGNQDKAFAKYNRINVSAGFASYGTSASTFTRRYKACCMLCGLLKGLLALLHVRIHSLTIQFLNFRHLVLDATTIDVEST